MARTLRNTAATFAGLLVLLAVPGWLYLLRPGVHGLPPGVPGALPLDELANKAGVPLLLFVATWGAGGLLLGLLARTARLERLTAAIVLALGVGAFELVAAGVSIAVVRQVSLHSAFEAAARARAVSLPPLLAALGGAICGRPRESGRSRAPLLLSWAAAAVGVVGLAFALLPSHDRTLLSSLAPDAVRPVTAALVGPLALALLVVAPGLARRSRRAWQVSLALLGGSTLLHRVPRVQSRRRGDHARRRRAGGAAARVRRARRSGDTPGPRLARRTPGGRDLRLRRARALAQPARDRPAGLTRPDLARDRRGAPRRALPRLDAPRPGNRRLVPALGVRGRRSQVRPGCCWAGSGHGDTDCARRLASGASRATWSLPGASTRSRRSCSAPTSRTSSRPTSAPSSPTGSSAGLRSSPVTRSGRRRRTACCSTSSPPSPESAAGGWRSSAPRSAASSSTGPAGCMPSTTVTKQWSRPAPSRSRAGRSGRCASRSTGSRAPATAPRCCGRGRSTSACATSSRGSRANGAAPSRSVAS